MGNLFGNSDVQPRSALLSYCIRLVLGWALSFTTITEIINKMLEKPFLKFNMSR